MTNKKHFYLSEEEFTDLLWIISGINMKFWRLLEDENRIEGKTKITYLDPNFDYIYKVYEIYLQKKLEEQS